MTTTRRSALRSTTLSTLLATFALTALPGCDEGSDGETDSLRAVTLSDGWGEHEPVHFPEVNSCYDYWNTRCAELSSLQCSYLRARYTCSSAMQGQPGVIISDHFIDTVSEVPGVWRVHVRGGKDFSAGSDTPEQACATLASPKTAARCKAMIGAAKSGPELLALAPAGGIAPILPLDELGDELPFFAGDLGLELLEPLDWTLPALDFEARVALAEYFVTEDEIMLLAGPEGTVVVSSKDIVLIRDVRTAMDKVEVCVDVDVK